MTINEIFRTQKGQRLHRLSWTSEEADLSYRSKEDEVVDAYVLNRRSKAGKRFSFVRFVKVFDAKRLVNNLCTVWIRRYKLHANIPRFQREPLNKHSNLHNNFGEKRGSSGTRNNNNEGLSNPKGFMVVDQCDVSLSLTGKVGFYEEEGDKSDEDTFDDEFGKDNSKANMNFNSEGDSDKEEVQEMIFSSHKVESKRRDDINDNDDVLISLDETISDGILKWSFCSKRTLSIGICRFCQL
ncbi:hypothetical protein Tco_0802717 [Tanacetum coccineum]|uniref:RRM domain-containing protein n=1 Tax=Tanacetum coccineum TaxID=301880 RepID=A0ABQ4ZZL1_9ASTR